MSFTTDLTALKDAITSFKNKISTKFSDYILKTSINAASGICPLDANKLVPMANLSISKGDPGIQGPPGPSTYDLHNFINGKPLVNEVIMRAVAVRSFTIPANCAGSIGICTTPASVVFTIAILKNGAQIGTITFAAGSTSATFSMATAASFNNGDQVALRCIPAAQDTTLSDIALGIFGYTV